jgi:hypothetical protein
MEKPRGYRKFSPHLFADKFKTPTLVFTARTIIGST